MKKTLINCSKEPIGFFQSKTFDLTVISSVFLLTRLARGASKGVSKTSFHRCFWNSEHRFSKRIAYVAEAFAEGGSAL